MYSHTPNVCLKHTTLKITDTQISWGALTSPRLIHLCCLKQQPSAPTVERITIPHCGRNAQDGIITKGSVNQIGKKTISIEIDRTPQLGTWVVWAMESVGACSYFFSPTQSLTNPGNNSPALPWWNSSNKSTFCGGSKLIPIQCAPHA